MEVLNKEKVLEHAKRLIEEGKVDRAILEYRSLLDIDPKDMRIKIRIAELLARQKKMSEAVKVYKEVADSYTGDGFYLKAVTVYKNVLRLNPSLIDINYRLAELYEKMGLNKDAVHQYQILSNSLEQKGDYNSLIDVRRKIVEMDPHNIANRIRLAETYQYQGMEDNSLNEYEKLVTEIKGTDKEEQLIEMYEKILSYRPDNLEMVRALCRLYYKRGEWKKIIGHLDKKGDVVEKETDLLLMQAEIYARLNQFESAKNKYKEAAAIFIEGEEIDKALDAYKEVLVISPDEEEDVKELVAEIDPDYFEKVKTAADEKRKRIEEQQARLAEEVQASEEGEVAEELKKAIPRFSEDEIETKLHEADAAFELGKAYHQMGLKGEAEPELNKCLIIYKALERSGRHDEEMVKRIRQIVEWLGVPKAPEKAEKVQVEKVEPEEEKPAVEKKIEAVSGREREPVSKPKKKPAQKGDKKKNRMGFV